MRPITCTRSSEACGCGSGTTKEPSVIVRSRAPETDRLSETAVLLAAIVTRLDARTVRRRRERRPNLVRDADTASFTLNAGDREQMPDRQPGLRFDDLEDERDRHDPL